MIPFLGFEKNFPIIQGKISEKIEIAKNLLNLDIPLEKIILATNLTKDEIENLIK